MANDNSGSGGEGGGPNMRWGHRAAPDGSWEYSWGAGSVPGGPTFGYGSGSARSDGATAGGSGFGFSWGTGGSGSGSGWGSASGSGSGWGSASGSDQNQYSRFGQSFMHMPNYGARFYNGMPFGHFPMGPIFGPPHGTNDNGGRGFGHGSRGGGARFSS
ncbi:hypothetical protein RDABS01_008933 [Bienertia sinuspersici]